MSNTCTSGQNSLLQFELLFYYGYMTRRDNHDDAKQNILGVRVCRLITQLAWRTA